MGTQPEQRSKRQADEQRVREMIAESGAKRSSIDAYLEMIAWYRRQEATVNPPPPRKPHHATATLVG